MDNKYVCGHEDDCNEESCSNCPHKHNVNITVTEAELTALEDLAVNDLNEMTDEELRRRQITIKALMQKLFDVC